MGLIARSMIARSTAFVIYPILFVLWNGPDRDYGYIGGVVMMMFVEFISPYHLWVTPLVIGCVVAVGWHLYATRNSC